LKCRTPTRKIEKKKQGRDSIHHTEKILWKEILAKTISEGTPGAQQQPPNGKKVSKILG